MYPKQNHEHPKLQYSAIFIRVNIHNCNIHSRQRPLSHDKSDSRCCSSSKLPRHCRVECVIRTEHMCTARMQADSSIIQLATGNCFDYNSVNYHQLVVTSPTVIAAAVHRCLFIAVESSTSTGRSFAVSPKTSDPPPTSAARMTPTKTVVCLLLVGLFTSKYNILSVLVNATTIYDVRNTIQNKHSKIRFFD